MAPRKGRPACLEMVYVKQQGKKQRSPLQGHGHEGIKNNKVAFSKYLEIYLEAIISSKTLIN